jgi:tetratricopeptide (TPR) repeat protein/4-amino-4-deoxy-L-arabinose transferase-like glycosyltransferase
MAQEHRGPIATIAMALSLFAAVVLIYHPAWKGDFVWDDEVYVLEHAQRASQGLLPIWTDVNATHQYFPVVHSVFWLEYRLWGERTLGYHLVNIILHGVASLLFWMLLRRLDVKGAYLAAAIFALHPVHVESVAWISELKNTLSGVFYLATAMAYLAFDRTRHKRYYTLALALFTMAVLSKTTTATLPAALLVVLWWKRGRLTWKADALPLLPFFAVGIAQGLFTAWLEYHQIGARGTDFALTTAERCLIAGRAFWFYLGKLLWPANLIINYPRWQISSGEGWQYLFPLAAVAFLVVLWRLRDHRRDPFAVILLFAGTLFPVLGFFNLYFFHYAFVADHFLYLPCLAPIAWVASGFVCWVDSHRGWSRIAAWIACGAIILILAILSWDQTRVYRDKGTLYRATIARNPDSWMAYNNLGLVLAQSSRTEEAISHYEQALRLKPDNANAHNNLGCALAVQGLLTKAICHYQQALRIKPDYADAHTNWGVALMDLGRLTESLEHFEAVVRIAPTNAEAYWNCAKAMTNLGRPADAIEQCKLALQISPHFAAAHNVWGNALMSLGRSVEAIQHYESALRLKPDYAIAHNNWGNALLDSSRPAEAIEHYRQAVEIQPDLAAAQFNWTRALLALGRPAEAVEHGRIAARASPHEFQITRFVAWLMATHESIDGGNPDEAVKLAEQACMSTGHQDVACLDSLAAAYASAQRFNDALATAKKAWQLAQAAGRSSDAEEIHMRIQVYRDQRPYREPLPKHKAATR